ncbi:MAG: antibiotic biosynthesis monooxygenase [Cyanobacteria bacterium]|nr:antibiotic biosynthesis monooxygenase [Cyanobacteriota bacterium]
MLIIHVFVHVKSDSAELFKEETIRNAQNSIKEPGIIRFDVIQQEDDFTQFLLIEMYKNAEAAKKHKDTAHYIRWREAVEPLLAEPRKSIKYVNIFPDDSKF